MAEDKKFKGTVIKEFTVGNRENKKAKIKASKKRHTYKVGDTFEHTNKKVFDAHVNKKRVKR